MSDSDSSDGDFSAVLEKAAMSDGESVLTDDESVISETDDEVLDLPNTDDEDSDDDFKDVEQSKKNETPAPKKLLLKQDKIKKQDDEKKKQKSSAMDVEPSKKDDTPREKKDEVSKPKKVDTPREKKVDTPKPTEEQEKSKKPKRVDIPPRPTEEHEKSKKDDTPKKITKKSTKKPEESSKMDVEEASTKVDGSKKKKRKAVDQPEKVESKKVKEVGPPLVYVDTEGEVVDIESVVRRGDNKFQKEKTEHKHLTYIKAKDGIVACRNDKQWPDYELLEISVDTELAYIKAASGRKRCILSQLVKAESVQDDETVKAFTNESSSHFIIFSSKAKASVNDKKKPAEKKTAKPTVDVQPNKKESTPENSDFSVSVSFNFKSDKAASAYLNRITSISEF